MGAAKLLRTWYPLLLALVGAGASALVYARLPASMAVHWDLEGSPNGWMPRPLGAFFGPAFLLVLWGLLREMPRLDPRAEVRARRGRGHELIAAAALLLAFATHLVVLGVALGYRVPVVRLAPALVGALFVVIGVVMPRTRANWWFGIRTPWTMASDGVWTRTHQLASSLMVAAGAVMILAALALPGGWGLPVVLGAAVAAAVGPAVYSWLTWRRERHEGG